MPIDNTTLIKHLLEKCDLLYRENCRLKQLASEKLEQHDMKEAYETQLSEKETLIAKKDARISSLEKQISELSRRLYGKKSERFIKPDALQRKLDFEGLDILPEEKEAAQEAEQEIRDAKEAARIRREANKKRPVRKPLPASLPREEIHIYPQGYNEEQWTLLPGGEVTELLVHEPGKFYVRRIIRHTAKRKDTKEIKTGEMPVLPIAKSYASSSLLADLMVGKYVDHLPFHRQLEQFRRVGVHLPPPTVNGWFREVADLLRPLHFRLQELVMQADYLQSDETTMPVVHEEKHKAVKGYIWLVRSVMDGRQLFYYDHGSRSGKVVLKLFSKFKGALQTDGYEPYEQLDAKKGVILLGCWAHARRKFWESRGNDESRSEYALKQIQLLYDVERQADDANLGYEERAELRSRLAYPILVRFEKWLVAEYPKVLGSSPIGKAIKYTYQRFDKLSRYHLDGRYKPDNNQIENKIRAVALGRKNYLFCGNGGATEDAAVIYSFMGCCKSAEVDFRTWMIYFLDHVHDYDDDYSKDLAELLPDNLKAAGRLTVQTCLETL
jgi:transposase